MENENTSRSDAEARGLSRRRFMRRATVFGGAATALTWTAPKVVSVAVAQTAGSGPPVATEGSTSTSSSTTTSTTSDVTNSVEGSTVPAPTTAVSDTAAATPIGGSDTTTASPGGGLPFTGGDAARLAAIGGGAVVLGEAMRRLRNADRDYLERDEPSTRKRRQPHDRRDDPDA